ncbi:TPA: bacteriocin immunity protein [Yersinia enterocolitica]|uniref:Bacteriocin immunity protein n=5 Tax=Yersinia enterocolitica TaxID=630 RepID=A0A0E1NH73_YEREN|nr:bacteriocin immunity protein [Yersinia enterocolitica]CBX70171.1 pyocin-S2 immunity protein [Yersinia enterocolitica W22703]ADZ40656.1 Colicin-E2 immunity protein [Yersinia enterocolitica subsp. palearctica 105.5R(r)]AJJ28429.1 pyocin-S2 immunity protein [Yersinia enterocolitica]ALG80441.1 colicin transporter [Yersinia enterocolitica]AOF13277.1 colicin transporter [Yersinia enterocolitica]
MENKKLSDYTELEFLNFVKNIYYDTYPSEEEHIRAILQFENLIEHPDGSDLIYYHNDEREDSPEGVLAEVKKWRAENGKPGFKE